VSSELILVPAYEIYGKLCNGLMSLQFLRQELKCEGGDERRQKAFHRNDDMHISVRELWDAWIRSEVCVQPLFTLYNYLFIIITLKSASINKNWRL